MNNRSRTLQPGDRCTIFGCGNRGVKGYTTLLCEPHRRAVVEDLTHKTITLCAWPACAEYGIPPTRHCGRHIALIAFHGLRNPTAQITLDILREAEAKNAAPAAPSEPATGTVYYLRSGGYFKIGWTSNLEKRMKGYPPDTTLLAIHPGTKKDERRIHKRFAHLISNGREWFVLAPEIHDHIERVIAEHGAPPVVDFTARRANRTAGRRTEYIGGPNRGQLAPRQVRG